MNRRAALLAVLGALTVVTVMVPRPAPARESVPPGLSWRELESPPRGLCASVLGFFYGAGGTKWQTTPMQRRYRGEDEGRVGFKRGDQEIRSSVSYLERPDQRTYFQVHVRDGQLYRRDTAFGSAGHPVEYTPFDTDGKTFIFVMDAHGNLYAGEALLGLFHHSSFLAGQPVAAAGQLVVVKGRLRWANGHSGHYVPTAEHFAQFLHQLEEEGVEMGTMRYAVAPLEEGEAPVSWAKWPDR